VKGFPGLSGKPGDPGTRGRDGKPGLPGILKFFSFIVFVECIFVKRWEVIRQAFRCQQFTDFLDVVLYIVSIF